MNDPAVKRVRELARATGDAAITEDQAHVVVETSDGRRVEAFVAESLGNLRRPLSDAQLEDKFRDQAAVNLPADVVDALIEHCWRIDQAGRRGRAGRGIARAAGAWNGGNGGSCRFYR